MRFFERFSTGLAAFAAVATLATTALAADISGAGATFPFPVYSKWASAYKAVSGNGLNYQSIGSGGGIKQIESKTVTFGASDMPLPVQELNKFGLVQFPTVIGGVVPVVNVKGVMPGQMVIDGPTLANIYLGKVSKWNDAAIKKLNPGMNLPDQPITAVYRSDGSGTTFIFTNYLSKVSKEWNDKVKFATAVDWPTGIGAKGNEGVAGNVGQTAGSIGFVEYAYAKQNNLAYAKLINKDGKTVSPVAAAFAAAASGAMWDSANGFGTILTDQPGANTWPIAGATFVIVYKQPQDPAATKEALKFFQWAYQNGDQMAAGLDYVSFPSEVKQKIVTSWGQVQGWNGGH
ncbi:MAG TPA: phosphate ABC transporter substrate-binding protein PstS [Micropepsaceae bacterium]|nr:phosphate ABC transporter substrate-binding protein PstS [Micropepsaceae bacterium]